ncbi:MAG TPA: UDP-N-acetylglucosamine 2-epimerase (non-hydrolyzing) [Anaerolineales bacterium]|nr:UDP-N-acetylglucosamine 2-epimerase (non-hydrolyzing) [Anaerolineales bacterium]
MKVLSIFGTRPEAVKMAPIVQALAHEPRIQSKVLVTAQHREMLDQVLEIFRIQPDYDLNVMQPGQTPTDVAAAILSRLQPILADEKPDYILVQGDTTTVMAASIAAVYARVKVGHVEAGLRTYDRNNPFPEEYNRVITDAISDMHFAPTLASRSALLKEGIPAERIHVTGNTVIDALHTIVRRLQTSQPPVQVDLPSDKKVILVTSHRRENFGEPLHNILTALSALAKRPDVHLVFPVHRNPNVLGPVQEALGHFPNITLLPPQDYFAFVYLMGKADIVLTDSGGVQEEAPGLGKPVLVMRLVTERPEAVHAGTARLVGTDSSRILAETTRLLDDPAAYQAMAQAVNPFGDGKAAERTVKALLGEPYTPFG